MLQHDPFHYFCAVLVTIAFCYIQSGTINVPGGNQALGSGGVVLDDNQQNGNLPTTSDAEL
jgi:hypothetical protein